MASTMLGKRNILVILRFEPQNRYTTKGASKLLAHAYDQIDKMKKRYFEHKKPDVQVTGMVQ